MTQTWCMELLASYAADNRNSLQFYLHLELRCETER
jgi:hypothetical protein